MQSTLNTGLLASMLKSTRDKKGLRTVANEIGDVSFATLSRIEQGKIPDVDTFIKICNWLNVPTDTFIINDLTKQPSSLKEKAIAHLRADRTLSPETFDAIVKMIDIAYNSK